MVGQDYKNNQKNGQKESIMQQCHLHTKQTGYIKSGIFSLIAFALMSVFALSLMGCTPNQDATESSEPKQTDDSTTTSPKDMPQADSPEQAQQKDKTPSTKTGFVDIWYPTYVRSFAGIENNEQDIIDYEHINEINCLIELSDDQSAAVVIPYRTFVTDWTQEDDTHGTLFFVFSNTPDENNAYRGIDLHMELSEDKNTLTMKSDGAEDEQFVIICKRNPDTSFDPYEDGIAEYEKHNDSLYENLPLDTDLPDSVIYEDEFLRLTLLGTTHSDDANTIGYWIEAVNKSAEQSLIAMPEFAPDFTVHGVKTYGLYSRVIPPSKTKHIFLAFERDQINNDLSDVHGQMIFFGYDGEEVTQAQIDL